MTVPNGEDDLRKQAVAFYKQGQHLESRDLLRDFFLHDHALLWLAKASLEHHPQEALAAVQLALQLDPGSEAAQRAMVAVQQRIDALPDHMLQREHLAAAVALTTGMTLTQARAVTWPFKSLNRSIGELLDQQLITLRDLAWVCERDSQSPRDIHLRDAARTILLTHLLHVEPKEPPRPLRVVSSSRYIEQQERIAVVKVASTSSIALLLLAVALIGAAAAILLGRQYPWLVIVSGSVMLVVSGLNFLLSRFSRQFEQYRAGRHGEEAVVEALRASLDGRWTMFRNVAIPHQAGGDLDLVLVGPAGVWVFEELS